MFFQKKVNNFQYPNIYSYFPTSLKNPNSIVSLENNDGFIQQIKNKNSNIYWIASSLDIKNSNFTNSPLIVPIFYNFGKTSLQHSKLHYTLDKTTNIDVNIQLAKDEILTIKNKQSSFIPLQQTFQNKATLTIKEKPETVGFYTIFSKEKAIKQLAFNNPKEESSLTYLNMSEIFKNDKNITVSPSIKDVLTEMNKKNEVRWLWKWFLAMAIVSLLLEIFILKFFKV